MTLRYGLIGSGMMGQEHIRNIALLDGVELVALSDPDEPMRQQAGTLAGNDPARFRDHKELLSANLCDAYIVASPNDTHYALMQDLLEAGKPVLCEKPICTTSADAKDLLRRAEGKAPVWVAMEYRYMPPIQALLHEIDTGTTGDPVMLAIREHRFPFLEKVGDWNRFNRRTGGTLTEKCCHFWDLMRLLLKSDPVRVYASGAMNANHLNERYDGERPDIIDNAFVIVDFENGCRGMLDLCMFAEGSKWQEVISVTGPRARVDACIPGPARFSADSVEHQAEIAISDRQSKVETSRPVHVDEAILAAGDHHGSTFYQHQAFRDMILNGAMPEVSLVDGLWSVRVGEAAEHSARTGQSVDLKSSQD